MLKIKPTFLKNNGKAEFVVLSMNDYAKIQEALEDAEDFRLIEDSKRRDAGKPGHTLEEVKRKLGIVASNSPARKARRRRRRSAS